MKYKWGQLISLEYGKPVTDKAKVNGKYPVYGTNGQIGTSDLPPLCNHASFILGRKGAYRGVHYSSIPFSVIDTAFYAENLHPELLNIEWAYYKFLTYDINSMDSGSAIPSTDRYGIYAIEVDLPDYGLQEKVVGLLRSFDDKIKLNNKINDNLQQQAEAIFQAWFIDFAPYGGTMPSNWKIGTLGESTEMSAGGDKPKVISSLKTQTCPYPIYSNGLSEEGLYGYTDVPKITDESVTVSARGTIGYVCLRHVPYVPIVRLVALIPKTELISAKFLDLYLKQLHISGTGTTQQQLTVPDFRKTEILIPALDAMEHFSALVTPLYDSIWHNQEQNKKLAALRDTLLPKLMSGEIDASNIDL